MTQITYIQIGNIVVPVEINDPAKVDRANTRIQKKIASMRLRAKFLRQQALSRITASKIILNC